MNVQFHNPKMFEARRFIKDANAHHDFTVLSIGGKDGMLSIYLDVNQFEMARAIADIFNGDLPALVSRIEDVMIDVNGRDHGTRGTALAIACDLIGKDLDEALRERREAEDAE